MNIHQYKPAAPSLPLLLKGLSSGKYEYQDGELHKRCTKCKDYWPADTEFFFAAKVADGIDNTCRACYMERRYPNGRKEAKCKH